MKKVRRPRSRTRFPNRLPLLSGRRNSLSNCASRVIWLPRVCHRHGCWSRVLSQERLAKSDSSESGGRRRSQKRRDKRPGRRNWRRRGGGRGGWVGRRRRPPVQVGAKTSGVRLAAKPDYGIAEASRSIRLPWTGFLADGTFTSFDAPQSSSSAFSVTILRFRATPPSYHTIDLAVRLT